MGDVALGTPEYTLHAEGNNSTALSTALSIGMTFESDENNLNDAHHASLLRNTKRFKPLSWSPKLRRLSSMTTSMPCLAKPNKRSVTWFKPTLSSAHHVASYTANYIKQPVKTVDKPVIHPKHFRTETMQDRLSLLLSHALMPRQGVPKSIEPHKDKASASEAETYTSTELQTMFIILGELVHKLTTLLHFEADEMATTILFAQRLRRVQGEIPMESIRTVAYTCAMMASKHCNDDHYSAEAFAQLLHVQKNTLLKFEGVLFNILWKNDEFVVNTTAVEQAIEYIENVDLDYDDVMPPNEKRPIWSINRVQQWEDDVEELSQSSQLSPTGHDRDHVTGLRSMETSPQTAPTTPVRIENEFALPEALDTQASRRVQSRIFRVSVANPESSSVPPRELGRSW